MSREQIIKVLNDSSLDCKANVENHFWNMMIFGSCKVYCWCHLNTTYKQVMDVEKCVDANGICLICKVKRTANDEQVSTVS